MKQKKLYYGWVVVVGCFLLLAFGIGIGYSCFSLYIKPICEDMGYSRTQVALVQTISFTCSFVLSFFSGKIFKKFGVKTMLRAGSVLLPLSWVIFGSAPNLPALYLGGVVLALGFYSGSMMSCSIIMGNWFKNNLATITGITFMGSGFGAMVFNSVSGVLLTNYGWRTSMLILSAVIAVVTIPMAFFVIKTTPQEMGLLPLGSQDDEKEQSPVHGLTLKQAMGTYQFWLFAAAFVVYNIPANMLNQTVYAHMTDVGYSITTAANITAAVMASMAISKIVLGAAYDKLGVRTASLFVCLCLLISYLGLYYASSMVMVVITVIFIGTACSFGTMANPAITRTVFGTRDYAAIYGIIGAFGSMGGMITPIFSNSIFEATGSYNLAYLIGVGMTVLLAIIIIAATASKPKVKQ